MPLTVPSMCHPVDALDTWHISASEVVLALLELVTRGLRFIIKWFGFLYCGLAWNRLSSFVRERVGIHFQD